MTQLRFGDDRRKRRLVSLTPMIDIVFLLLVFFVLASRFGSDDALSLSGGNVQAGDWTGPPRLLSIAPDGISFNGESTTIAALDIPTEPPLLILTEDGTTVADIAQTLDALNAAGFARPVLLP